MTVTPENKPPEKTEQAQTQVPPVENKAAAPTEPQPNIKSEENQANWKTFREKQAAERKAREDAEKRFEEEKQRAEAYRIALEASVNKPSNNRQTNDYGSDPTEEIEEQRIERKFHQLLKKQREEDEKARIEKERLEIPKKLTAVYPDFDKVFNDENLDYLKFHYPEVASTFDYLPQTFESYANVYKTLKRFIPNNQEAKQDAQKVEKNLAKPGSISSTGNTHSGNAMGQGGSVRLSEARMAENWSRMQARIKSLKD